MLGRRSTWCSAGDEMAARVSIRDDMTSVDAGFTTTRLDGRRPASWWEAVGRERRRRSAVDLGVEEVLTDVLCGMMGPSDGSTMANGSQRHGMISA